MIRAEAGTRVKASHSHFREETVLVIEEDGPTRRLLGKSLREHGFSAILAANGEDAIEVCKRHLGRVDVVVAPLLTRITNGRELATQLANLRPSLRFIYLANQQDSLAANKRVDGEENILREPFRPSELADKIRQSLELEPTIAASDHLLIGYTPVGHYVATWPR